MNITFGDKVKVLASPETDAIGISGKVGLISGETKPAATGVDVIGEIRDDFALSVSFEGYAETYWLSSELLEFVDHAEGTEFVAGNVRAIRKADGSWEETYINPPKRWWQIWK